MSFTLDILLPLLAIGALAILVPLGLARLLPRSLGAMLVNLSLSVVILFLAGALILAAFYLWAAPDLWAAFAGPGAMIGWIAARGLPPVIVWLPILALTELTLAQRIAGEARP